MTLPGGSVVTIGTYDGVHLGHQRLIGQAKDDAAFLGLRSVVVTFDRHPAATVRPAVTPKLLTDLDLKLELIGGLGVDEIVVLEFDEARALETAEAFAADLVTDLEAQIVLVGENFRFGRDQRGDISLLEHLGSELGFTAKGIPLVTDDSAEVVSSRRARELIAVGDLVSVARLLGRPFELRGRWAPGPQIGFVSPFEGLAVPPAGRYRARLRLPGAAAVPDVLTAMVGEDGSVALARPRALDGIVEGDVVGVCFLAEV